MGRNLISRVATFYQFKCSVFNKIYKTHKEIGTHTQIKQPKETIPKEAQMLNLQDFKLAIINMFKEQKEIMSKESKESMRIMPH